MGFEIKLNVKDRASATIAAIADTLEDLTPLNKILGKRFEYEVREHFAGKESEPNKKGWPKQNFWSRIRNATAYLQADKSGATVRISDPAIASKIWGAEIEPKETKYLALPAIAEAYGRSPRLNKGLSPVVRKKKGQKARAVALADEQGTVWYWLVKRVSIPRDPEALPKTSNLRSALIEEAGDYFKRLSDRNNAG